MSEMKFDDSLRKLEEIVRRMEEENLPLETALREYEKGVKLASICLSKLNEAENRIESLRRDARGLLHVEPFAGEETNGE